MTTRDDGRAERDAALLMLHELTRKRSGRITTGADKAYDTRDFVSTVRELGVTPHVARRQHGAIDERTSRRQPSLPSTFQAKRWEGKGPVVVLIHGYAENSDSWAPLAADLMKNQTVSVGTVTLCGVGGLHQYWHLSVALFVNSAPVFAHARR